MCFCFSEFWIKIFFMTTYYNSLVGIIFSIRFLSICLCVRKHTHTTIEKEYYTLLPPVYKNVNAAHWTAWKTDKNIFTARLVSFDCLSNDFVFICTKWQWRQRSREIKKILNQTNECGDVRRLGRKKKYILPRLHPRRSIAITFLFQK